MRSVQNQDLIKTSTGSFFVVPPRAEAYFDEMAQEGALFLGSTPEHWVWSLPRPPLKHPQRPCRQPILLQDRVLYTRRLELSEPRMAETKGLYDLIYQPEVLATLAFKPCANLEEYQHWVAKSLESMPQGNLLWAIRLSDGTPIGTITVMNGEIGYVIGKAYQNQGYAREALLALLHVLLTEGGYDRVTAAHTLTNPASGRVMAACGMHATHTFRRRAPKDDSYPILLEWALTAEDLDSLKPQFSAHPHEDCPNFDDLLRQAQNLDGFTFTTALYPEQWWADLVKRGCHLWGSSDGRMVWHLPATPIPLRDHHFKAPAQELQTLTLKTGDLTLSSPSLADGEALYESDLDPRSQPFLSFQPKSNLSSYLDWLSKFLAKQQGYHHFFALHDSLDKAIGLISCTNGELGYALHPDAWNKGYARQALAAVIKAHFDAGAVQLKACHFCSNPASGRVLQACGFRPTHIAPLRRPKDNQCVHHLHWQLSLEEYEALWARGFYDSFFNN